MPMRRETDEAAGQIDNPETKKSYCGDRLGGAAEGGTDNWGEVVTR